MSQNTPQQRAKRPASAIAGPYGHPFHPILVTIPIGSWVASLVFDIIGLVSDDPEPYVRAAWILIVIGLIGAVLAAIWGFIDYLQLGRSTVARRTATIHMSLNLGVTVLFIINLLVRLSADEDDVSIVGFILSIVGLAALGVSGWLGGKLAYRYGVRVADERTQMEGYR
ncbi:DUF2231 domain-containing protein [Microbacterium timonense]|jgi:uncharacterized membrane protein|uniref:DUF2231 domain-containing protein n=1 Tax=Microbacterium timonense TaxID=2086576 RepID=UPI000D0EE77A|nr:DUF2231 domain-containing protein [Microbacterium timonense]